ncbi:bifunctional UDP-N-acetylglucosamine diphosphorylase/glucosamine-1-phosphate N-acetyltransferase GlmU [Magnetococcus sp. PR-3]|uniref:bifunctional UDP-N-acetylglucosamine diphosphorylase/glucosamine-1-phosphate N-acetyltransferase GlmU n=1 Tax=Magnetococcus sp. PR-3 TaxID=3120355 RepID=UPI002FCE0630
MSQQSAVLILAAGKGTRMRSKLPKVLHPIAEKPLLGHVLDAARALNPSRLVVVIGHEGDQIRQALDADDITWVEQSPQLGTGHAVQCAMPHLDGLKNHHLLILNGDVPLIRTETLKQCLESHSQSKRGVTVLSCLQHPPTGYGRIVRDDVGGLERIVEEKDADPEVRKIEEINSGTYCVSLDGLPGWLSKLSNDNAQGEYYLTDIIALANAERDETHKHSGSGAHCHSDGHELAGINNRVQLAAMAATYRNRVVEKHMLAGVTFVDPSSCWVASDVTIGQDTIVAPHVILGPGVHIGEDCSIGAFTEMRHTQIGHQVEVLSFCHFDQAQVADGCTLGPYARLRPGSVLESKAKVGNFCEVKKSLIREGAKVNHLTYIGDADIGRRVNVGAGTITCNYDGVNKHKTVLGDDVFIGSDTQLVAPVNVGQGAFVGAGSTVTKDVPEGALALTRAKQTNYEGWAEKRRQSLKKK